MNKIFLMGFSLMPFIAACQHIPQNEGAPATISDVVSQIKKDIGEYQKYDATAAASPPLNNACGGVVGFEIESVKVTLTTQTNANLDGSGSATLPVGGALLAVNGGGSRESKGTQALSFMLYPKKESINTMTAPFEINPEFYPIAATLRQLRDGLLAASFAEPCVSLLPIDNQNDQSKEDGSGSFIFGFTVINGKTGGGNISFLMFSLGVTNSVQREASNAIAVKFLPRKGGASAYTIKPGSVLP